MYLLTYARLGSMLRLRSQFLLKLGRHRGGFGGSGPFSLGQPGKRGFFRSLGSKPRGDVRQMAPMLRIESVRTKRGTRERPWTGFFDVQRGTKNATRARHGNGSRDTCKVCFLLIARCGSQSSWSVANACRSQSVWLLHVGSHAKLIRSMLSGVRTMTSNSDVLMHFANPD